jgi:uncharacterized protein (DUF1778 family)
VAEKGYIVKTMRLLPLEDRLIEQACAALGTSRSSLMQEAALAEAARLGVRFTTAPIPPLREGWPYLPPRGDEPTGVRFSFNLSLTEAELVGRAAQLIHSSEPLFIIGATLAYVGRLQKCLQASYAGSPEEAAGIRKALERIKLPRQYQYGS